MKTEYTVQYSTLKIYEALSSKTLLPFARTVRCLVLEHHKFYVDFEKLKILWKICYLAFFKKDCSMSCVQACVRVTSSQGLIDKLDYL